MARTTKKKRRKLSDPFWGLVILACVGLVLSGTYFRFFSTEAVAGQLVSQWEQIESVRIDNSVGINNIIRNAGDGPQLDETLRRKTKMELVENRLSAMYIRDPKLEKVRDALLKYVQAVNVQTDIADAAADEPARAVLQAQIKSTDVNAKLVAARNELLAAARNSGYPPLEREAASK